MRTITSYPHRYRRKITRRSEHGQSYIEFALILPVLFLMLLGVTVIAEGINLQMVLHGAAYEGARVWAKNPIGGSGNHCSLPACDPTVGRSNNFKNYVMPVVRQYITNNGYEGDKVYFFAKDGSASQDAIILFSNESQFVRVTLLYPYQLPVGNLAVNFKEVLITASCAMKRGG